MVENARAIDGLREAVVAGFKAMERRFEAIDRRFEAIDQKMARQFLWVVGIQITTMLAVVAAMGGIAAVALVMRAFAA